MTAWLENALKKLTLEEVERVIRKVEELYKSGCIITDVHRSERQVRVTVQIDSGERKLVVL